MRRLRRLVAGATLGAIAGALTACGGGDGGGAQGGGDDALTVGASISQTGPYAASATLLENGYQLGVEKLNRDGGVLGQDVELIVKDDQSDPGTAVSTYTELFSQERVDVALGPYSSVLGQPVAAVGEKFKRPILHTFTSLASLFPGTKYNIQAYPPSETLLRPVPEFAKSNGVERLALLANREDGQQAICDEVRAQADELGVEVVFEGDYPSGTTDYSSLVVKAKQANPDGVALCGYLEEAIGLTRTLNQQGLETNLLASASSGQPEFVEALKGLSNRVITSEVWDPELETEGNQEFVRLYEEKFDKPPSYHAAVGYAAIQVLAAAAQENEAVDSESLNQALHDATVDTVLGTYDADEQAVQVGYLAYQVQWQDGELELVYPDDVATAELQMPYGGG